MTTLQIAFFALSLCLLGLQWASWRRFGEGEAKCKRLEGRVERLELSRVKSVDIYPKGPNEV